ncbi:MAG: DUF115 domain-containing protein [Euryarchaeota archaeon]|nr:DUF115 domain-containing protein [Euryarchaeota archaeon]
MNFKWKKFYYEILEDFSFSEKSDAKAAEILNGLLKPVDISILRKKIRGRRANVYGAGPSLEKIKKFPRGINIAADGATSFLLERGVVPDIIVTDLDGKIKDLLRANRKGSLVVVHAHGDNIDAIKKYAAKFKNAIGTTQSKPFGSLHNFGGFTDGDRAVFLAEHFEAKKIALYGMDFRSKIGRYSFSRDSKTKRKKLRWAEKLINYLRRKSEIEITWSKSS